MTETIEGSKPLKDPKEETFCQIFTQIGGEGFSKQSKAAELAGWNEDSARTTAWRLIRKSEIQKRIAYLHSENCSRFFVTEAKVLADLEHTKQKALDKNDFSAAARCIQLTGEFLQMFKKRFAFETVEEPEQLDPQQQAAYGKAAQDAIDKLSRSSDFPSKLQPVLSSETND
jgi:phage terminase small subunit